VSDPDAAYRTGKTRQQSKHGDTVGSAPFYIFGSQLKSDDFARLADIDRAVKLDPEQWRYGLLQARTLMQVGRNTEALDVLATYYSAHRENFILGLEYARCLSKEAQYSEPRHRDDLS